MIKLNLLPPAEKKILAAEQTQRWILFYGSSILAIFLAFITLLAAEWFYISVQLKSASESFAALQSGAQGQDLKSQEGLIKDLNRQLENISKIQQNHKSFSAFLVALTEFTPAGIKITNISIDEKWQAIITGHAALRDDMLAFKEALEKSGWTENLESPLANLLKQTDINFYFKFGIKTDLLVQ